MVTACGNVVLAFNGELYNHSELRRELEQLGHKFISNCDTEVALHAFVQWDTECFARFRGMFAAAFWNERDGRLILVRDRLGIKPLYFTRQRSDIFFGSELKAIFEHRQIPRKLCRKALTRYLSFNYIPGPLTLVEGIEKLTPGTWLAWQDGRVTTGTFWRNVSQPEQMTLTDATEELDRLISDSVREHLIADVPIGIWASGGLDSSTILHYAAELSRTKLRTFSISFRGRSFDESKHFRPLVNRYATQHEELDLNCGLDIADAIHNLGYYSDEPSADAGALPVWFLSKMTAGKVRVALSGEGADELFGGYQTYLADRYASLARRVPRSIRQMALRCVDQLPVSDRKIGLEYKLKRFLAGSMLTGDKAHFFWNGTFSDEQQRELGHDHGPCCLEEMLRLLPELPARQNLNRYLHIDQNFYLPDDILYKCDRMSMAHSLEVRPPFLDHRIVEFAARLPANLKIRGRTTKFILRELMKRKLPNVILNRRKEGLDIPAHEWLRGPLKPLLQESLSPAAVEEAGLFSSAAIQRLIAAHLDRKANLGYHLWGLLTLHLWIRRWNIQTEDETLGVLATAAG